MKGPPPPLKPPPLKLKGAAKPGALSPTSEQPTTEQPTTEQPATPTEGGPAPPKGPPMKGPPMKGPPMKGPPMKGPPVKGGSEPPPLPAALPPKKRPPPPQAKMKGLTWNKVPPAKFEKTIWNKQSDLEVPLDFKKMEDLFGAAVIEKKAEVKDDKKKKKEPVTLITDAKKSQNLNILLTSRFAKLTFIDIRNAILTLDETILTPEVTKQLGVYTPTDDELTTITEFLTTNDAKPEEDRLPLAKAEQYLYEVSKIPNLDLRFQALNAKLTFYPKLGEIKPDILNVKVATTELKNNDKIVKLLEIILYIGNFLNSGTFRGNIDGFKIDALPKILETKSADPKYNLLHYLVQLIEDKYTDLKEWPSAIQSSPAASKVSLPTIEADMSNLKKGLQTIENAISKVQHHENAPDKFKDIMTEFLTKGKTDYAELEATLSDTQKNFAALLELYGEDPKVTPEEFFKIWTTFITMYQKAKDENEKVKENEKKRAKRDKGKHEKKWSC